MCVSFVDIVISVHKKYKDMIEKIFQNDKNFHNALDKACITIINHSPHTKNYKSPELVRFKSLFKKKKGSL